MDGRGLVILYQLPSQTNATAAFFSHTHIPCNTLRYTLSTSYIFAAASGYRGGEFLRVVETETLSESANSAP